MGAVEHVFLSTGQDWNAPLVVTEQSMGGAGIMLANQFLDSSKRLFSETCKCLREWRIIFLMG